MSLDREVAGGNGEAVETDKGVYMDMNRKVGEGEAAESETARRE